jgi:homospermidine synthase
MKIHVIGFGSVGQAFHRMLTKASEQKQLGVITSVSFYAPEIKEKKVDGLFSFHPCPAVERETLVPVLDLIAAKPGDILLELATRIDTITIWKAAKARGLHFINSGFDCWGDVELDLENLVSQAGARFISLPAGVTCACCPLQDLLKKDSAFSAGKGPTAVFSMGMNPGVVNHFVRYGLQARRGVGWRWEEGGGGATVSCLCERGCRSRLA